MTGIELEEIDQYSKAKSARISIFAVVCCMCLATLAYQSVQFIGTLQDPPPISRTRYEYFTNTTFPSLTICMDLPFWPIQDLVDANITDSQGKIIWENVDFENTNVTKLWNSVTYDMEKAVTNDTSNAIHHLKYVTKTLNTLHQGRCVSIIPEATPVPLKYLGYFLSLKYPHEILVRNEKTIRLEYMQLSGHGRKHRGFNVYVHDDAEWFIESKQYGVSRMFPTNARLNYATMLKFGISRLHKVYTKDQPCTTELGYTFSQCIEDCLLKNITTGVGCKGPWMNGDYPICNTREKILAVLGQYRMVMESKSHSCHCIPTCNTNHYHYQGVSSFQVIKENVKNGDAIFAITSDATFNTVVREIIQYNGFSFAADVGGSIGLLLGLSVVGMLELAESFITSVWHKYIKRAINYHVEE